VGFDRNVLIQAGIERADAFAATSSSDAANIIAARIARQIFYVPVAGRGSTIRAARRSTGAWDW
jgi:Trk K+ transport system NAD-binding subunit